MKACPFCGGNDLVPSLYSLSDKQIVCVSCEGCDAEGPPVDVNPKDRPASLERAHKFWNRRGTKNDPAPPMSTAEAHAIIARVVIEQLTDYRAELPSGQIQILADQISREAWRRLCLPRLLPLLIGAIHK
jgi:hypothetical protein